MTDAEIKLWTALIAAAAALIVATITHLSNRNNQKAIEQLRDDYDKTRGERNAKRDYEYEARKRLYQECGPPLFQLVELSESAFYRITNLAAAAKQGNLEPGQRSYLYSGYYRISTLYRLLAPSALLKIIQSRLTLIDLSLDRKIWLQYTLTRQSFFAFGDEFLFASLGNSLIYEPFDKEARTKSKSDPAAYWRQGLPLGVIESAIEVLLTTDKEGNKRLMTYAECEAEYNDEKSRVREQFDAIAFLIHDFHPRTRPVFWRILVTQAVLYYVLSNPIALDDPKWGLRHIQISTEDRSKFDWRSAKESMISDASVFEPLSIAEHYLEQRMGPRLQRFHSI
jgi:hypothetical protein